MNDIPTEIFIAKIILDILLLTWLYFKCYRRKDREHEKEKVKPYIG